MSLTIYPAVDILGGRVVQLVGGDPSTKRVDLPDPSSVALDWSRQGAQWIHVVDLDGALGRPTKDGRDWLLELAATGLQLQVGGGIRTTKRVEQLLAAGIQRVVVGTRAVQDPDWLAGLSRKHPRRIVLALDARDGTVVSKGWTQNEGLDLLQTAQAASRLPLAGILFTAVEKEGRMVGMDRKRLAQLARLPVPIIASGGITTLDDIHFLRDTGIAGAVLGMAIYTGKIRLSEAQAAAEGAPSSDRNNPKTLTEPTP